MPYYKYKAQQQRYCPWSHETYNLGGGGVGGGEGGGYAVRKGINQPHTKTM